MRQRLAVLVAREKHLGMREKAIAHTLAEEERRAGHLVKGGRVAFGFHKSHKFNK